VNYQSVPQNPSRNADIVYSNYVPQNGSTLNYVSNQPVSNETFKPLDKYMPNQQENLRTNTMNYVSSQELNRSPIHPPQTAHKEVFHHFSANIPQDLNKTPMHPPSSVHKEVFTHYSAHNYNNQAPLPPTSNFSKIKTTEVTSNFTTTPKVSTGTSDNDLLRRIDEQLQISRQKFN